MLVAGVHVCGSLLMCVCVAHPLGRCVAYGCPSIPFQTLTTMCLTFKVMRGILQQSFCGLLGVYASGAACTGRSSNADSAISTQFSAKEPSLMLCMPIAQLYWRPNEQSVEDSIKEMKEEAT